MNGVGTGAAYNDGCSQGQRDAAYNSSSTVVLDFGGQTIVNGGWGTHYVEYDYIERDSVNESLATSFAQGYYYCTGADTTTVLTLAMGTNNSLYQDAPWGQDWAQVVQATASDVAPYASQVYVAGASDFEPVFGLLSAAESWMKEHAATTGLSI